jgi:hypothetical protein
MNCTHSERLIPLYVGGDLKAQQIAGVREHLETCGNCRKLAAEFEESQSWLCYLQAPEFEDLFFDNLHAAVRKEIARIKSSPPILDLLAPVWNWRSVIATSSTLALLTAGFLIYLNRQKSLDKPLTISRPESVESQNHEETANAGKVQQVGRRRLKANHRSRRASIPPADKRESNLPVVALNTHYERSGLMLPSNSELATKKDITEDPEREMTRIEIQTADPNIRIIWIAPKNPTR